MIAARWCEKSARMPACIALVLTIVGSSGARRQATRTLLGSSAAAARQHDRERSSSEVPYVVRTYE